MTIKEAESLLIQTLQFIRGGENFLLDMGEPINITELAKKMIKLSGLKLKDKKNRKGDIQIKYLKLFKKLFEELLVNGIQMPTAHNLIYKSLEEKAHMNFLSRNIKYLKEALEHSNIQKLIYCLSLLVPEWENQTFYLMK